MLFGVYVKQFDLTLWYDSKLLQIESEQLWLARHCDVTLMIQYIKKVA